MDIKGLGYNAHVFAIKKVNDMSDELQAFIGFNNPTNGNFEFIQMPVDMELVKELKEYTNKEMEMIELLKEKLEVLRIELDGITKVIDLSARDEQGLHTHQIHQSARKVEMAKAWSGILKKHLGGQSPYINDGKRHKVSDITSTANVSPILENIKDGIEIIEGRKATINFIRANQIEKLDFLREELEAILTEFQTIEGEYRLPNREASIARTEVWKYLVEAKMGLGFALSQIKDQADLVASANTTNEDQVSPN